MTETNTKSDALGLLTNRLERLEKQVSIGFYLGAILCATLFLDHVGPTIITALHR